MLQLLLTGSATCGQQAKQGTLTPTCRLQPACSSEEQALIRGHAACFKRLHAGGQSPAPELIRLAVAHRRKSILQWVTASASSWDSAVFAEAASVFDEAASKGNIGLLQWLVECGCAISCSAYHAAAFTGNLRSLRWLHQQGFPWSARACAVAAGSRHILVLQWARENGLEWTATTCSAAAAAGALSVLQWARSQGCPWNESTCSEAAWHGKLKCLKWARENGCPWNAATCRAAAEAGKLHILQWARANGCPWDVNTPAEAARRGQLHTMRWAITHGCPVDVMTCAWAAQRGHLTILQCARQLGCPWDGEVIRLTRCPQVLLWALENSAPPAHPLPHVHKAMLDMVKLRMFQCFAEAAYLAKRRGTMELPACIIQMAMVPREVMHLIAAKLEGLWSFTGVEAGLGDRWLV